MPRPPRPPSTQQLGWTSVGQRPAKDEVSDVARAARTGRSRPVFTGGEGPIPKGKLARREARALHSAWARVRTIAVRNAESWNLPQPRRRFVRWNHLRPGPSGPSEPLGVAPHHDSESGPRVGSGEG